MKNSLSAGDIESVEGLLEASADVEGENRGRPGSSGCHEESEARMVKVIFLL